MPRLLTRFSESYIRVQIYGAYELLLEKYNGNGKDLLIKDLIDNDSSECYREAWENFGDEFLPLMELASGLATIAPTNAQVESDISVINIAEGKHRTNLICFTTEGIMHAKQREILFVAHQHFLKKNNRK